ncbi:MAG: PDZ domain-containing protein [Candidatus Latescibacteria bacterium]|nr:PDZ domain-containing protein [Candidatus Latescibacterota bacterium]NIT39928.1 PDZ domain-containing protein [Candidatus Latescibacterota bacterium]
MEKIFKRSLRPGLIRSPVALMLVAVVSMAMLALAAQDADALKKKEKKVSGKGFLGITMQELTDEIIEGLDLKIKRGVLINEVFDDSPAEEAGLENGDVIVEYDSKKVDSTGELARLVAESKVGEKVKIKVIREDDSKVVTVIIGERPEEFAIDIPEVKVPKIGKLHISEPGHIFTIMSSKGRLGVRIEDLENEDLASYFDIVEGEGVLVLGVNEDSPAEEAGVKAGDVIVQLDDQKVRSADELIEAVGELEGGEEFELTVVRHGKKMTLTGEMQEGEHFEWYMDRCTTGPFIKGWEKSLEFDKEDWAKMRDKLRESRKKLRLERNDIRAELRELKKALEELREEIKDKLKDLEDEED